MTPRHPPTVEYSQVLSLFLRLYLKWLHCYSFLYPDGKQRCPNLHRDYTRSCGRSPSICRQGFKLSLYQLAAA